MKKEDYKVVMVRIEKRDDTKKLYELERSRNKIIEDCTKEWLRLVELNLKEKHDFWKVGIPSALFDILDAWDTKAGVVACKTFLEREGYEIKKVKK